MSTPENTTEVQALNNVENETKAPTIEEGIVSKRGPFPLRLWQKRILSFPSSRHSFPLYDLRLVYKKNVKKAQANRAEFERVNRSLLETIATATVNTSSMLAYFKPNLKDTPQGLINLRDVTSVEKAPKIKPNAFIIHCKNRDFVFSTQSKEDTDLWVSSIEARLKEDYHSYSDTEAYKHSYNHLVNRLGFLPPEPVSNPEEIFSASEAEFVSDEVPGNTQDSASTEDDKEAPAQIDEAIIQAETEVEAVSEQPEEDAKSDPEEAKRPISRAFSLSGLQAGIYSMFHKEENTETAEVKEDATEEVKELVEESKAEEIVSEEAEETKEPADESVAESKPEIIPSEEPKEEQRPFLVRLLSGNRKSKIETPTSPIVPEAPEVVDELKDQPHEEAPIEQPEKAEEEVDSRPFLARILSGKRKSKIEVEPLAVAEESALESATENEVPEEVQETAPVESEVKEVKAEEEESRPFLVRLLSGNRKSRIETPASPLAAEETEPVPEDKTEPEEVPEASAEESKEVPVTDEVVQESLPPEASVEHPNFLRRILSGKRKSTAEIPTSPKIEATQEVEAEPELSPEPEAMAEADKQHEEEPASVEVEAPSSSQEEADNRPFLVRVLSGKRKSLFGSPTSPKPEAPEPTPAEEVADVPIEATEITEEPVVAEEPAEAIEEAAGENNEVAEIKEEESSTGPARQPSLISRIGELAYSAVAPSQPAIVEEEEELNEHYVELSKDAMHAGYLIKQSYLFHSSNRRYAILDKEGVLTYFRSGSVVSEGKKIVLDENSEIELVDDNTFCIKAQGVTYNFSGKGAEERDIWIKHLHAALDAKKVKEIVEPEVLVEEKEIVEETIKPVEEVAA